MLRLRTQKLGIALGAWEKGSLRGESVNGGRFMDSRMTEGLQQVRMFLTILSLERDR